MKNKRKNCPILFSLFLSALMLFASAGAAFAEDEEEYIPEEYYESVQSNDTEGWPQGQAIQASSGVVMDLDTGAFLYAKNVDRQLYPASITKIMTCLLTLENVSLDDVMTCSTIVYELDDNASNTGLSEGEQMTVRDALYTLMLESANDTAHALAELVGGSMEGFAQMMNDRAASLGCTGTHFSNPSGLHSDDHYTTAHDMALIAQAAYANEAFRTLCSTVEYQVDPTNMYGDIRYLSNHHQMLQSETDYYTSWCTGGKTGFTQAAWNTLVTFGERDGKRLVCVLMHGNGADQNYLETIDLLNYGFDNFTHVDVSSKLPKTQLAKAMHVDYLGDAAALTAPELTQTIGSFDGYSVASVPAGSDASGVNFRSAGLSAAAANTAAVDLVWNGWPVGHMRAQVNPVDLHMTYDWQKVAAVSVEGQTGDKEVEIGQTKDIVWQNIGDFVNEKAEIARQKIAENRTAIILTFGILIIVLLILLLILLLRSTGDYRSKKKRRAAEQEALRREAEIDAKSTAQIEEELRQAMAEEEERRTQDEWMRDPNLQDLDPWRERSGSSRGGMDAEGEDE